MKKTELVNILTKQIKENLESDTLSQLEQALKTHDWYYEMSDDNRKYREGRDQESKIEDLMQKAKSEGKDQEAQSLYNKYNKYNVSEKLNETDYNSSNNKYTKYDKERDFYDLDKDKVSKFLSQFDNEEIDSKLFMDDDEGFFESESNADAEFQEWSDQEIEDWLKMEMSYYFFSKPDEINEILNERNLSPKELEQREKVLKGLKDQKHQLVKKYGKDAEKVMYGRAVNTAKKMTENNFKTKLKEVINNALIKETNLKETDYSQFLPKVGDKETKNGITYTVKSVNNETGEIVWKVDYTKNKPGKNIKETLTNTIVSKLREGFNPKDTLTMDVPLFIRLLEYAREDSTGDVDLHKVAEKAISLSTEGKSLSMEDYNNIVGNINE